MNAITSTFFAYAMLGTHWRRRRFFVRSVTQRGKSFYQPLDPECAKALDTSRINLDRRIKRVSGLVFYITSITYIDPYSAADEILTHQDRLRKRGLLLVLFRRRCRHFFSELLPMDPECQTFLDVIEFLDGDSRGKNG